MYDIPSKPRRRWPRFGLRPMFVVVTVLALFLGYNVNWMRQRQELIAQVHAAEARRNRTTWETYWNTMNPVEGDGAPGLLWLFDEKGIRRFAVPVSVLAPSGFEAEDRARILRS